MHSCFLICPSQLSLYLFRIFDIFSICIEFVLFYNFQDLIFDYIKVCVLKTGKFGIEFPRPFWVMVEIDDEPNLKS